VKKLNLGCWKDIKKDYINLDILKNPGVDVVWDIDKLPWPFKKEEFEEVYASHVLEHVENLTNVMKEIKRICKNKAKLVIRVPHFSCGVSYRDPTHKKLFSYFTFDYFKKGDYNLPVFNIISKKLNFTRENFTFLNYLINPIININPAIYERFFCWVLPCAEVILVLEIKK